MNKKDHIWIRITPSLKKELKELATKKGKPITEVITKMIENWINYQK